MSALGLFTDGGMNESLPFVRSLDNNEIGDEGVGHLSEALMVNKSLAYLEYVGLDCSSTCVVGGWIDQMISAWTRTRLDQRATRRWRLRCR